MARRGCPCESAGLQCNELRDAFPLLLGPSTWSHAPPHQHRPQWRAPAQVWYDFARWHSAEGGSGPAAAAAVLARARQVSCFARLAWQGSDQAISRL